MNRSFLDADVAKVVDALSIDEKIQLLGGKDFWRTCDIPRLNIPSVKLTDGPNGARGEKFFKMIPATVLPNATCLAATFSQDAAYRAGSLLASETKARNASCLLGPTVNTARNPLGGRTFEAFSEDSTLSGRIASRYIQGLQDNGVSACIKHFVANDQEHERMGADCVIRPRALREVYLRPFHLAQAYAKPWSYMTSYNKLNGTHCSENKWLLEDLLRGEWAFDGMVMSDWFGTYSVAEAINAGLDLEMPGIPRWRRKELVRQSINSHKTSRDAVDAAVTRVLSWVQRLARANPDLVYDQIDAPERTRWEDKEGDGKTIREIAGEGIVLLKNANNILPLRSGKVAVIGPNAKAQVLTGGGSARLRPAWTVTPWEGLTSGKPADIELVHSHGCKGPKFLPVFGSEMTRENGEPGFDLMHFAIKDGKQAPEPTVSEPWDNSDLILYDFYHPDLGKHYFTEIHAIFTAPITGLWEFEASVTGQGWLYIDDELVLDISKEAKRTSSFFGNGTEGTIVQLQVEQGRKYRFRFLHDSRAPPLAAGQDSTPLEIVGMKLGSFPAIDDDSAIAQAVHTAKASDVAVLVVGLNQDWESESFDRPSLSLPLRMNELIERVSNVTKTVVVMQAGSAVSMPWIDKVDAVVYSWYGGNNWGDAIADVLYGVINPSGRLPLTLPKAEFDIPARLNANSARTKIHYDEGIWVGYKHYNARHIPPLYPFGHGLSYTEFDYSALRVIKCQGDTADTWTLEAEVTITNIGSNAGSHSAHFYLTPPPGKPSSLVHPEFALQAFTKSKLLQPGEGETVCVVMDKYAISHWDELTSKWRVEAGDWKLSIGRDSSSMVLSVPFVVPRDMPWVGL